MNSQHQNRFRSSRQQRSIRMIHAHAEAAKNIRSAVEEMNRILYEKRER